MYVLSGRFVVSPGVEVVALGRGNLAQTFKYAQLGLSPSSNFVFSTID